MATTIKSREQVLAEEIATRKIAQANNHRLGQIVEDSVNEIFVFDQHSLRFLSVNRSARDNLGYTMEELQMLTPVDIIPAYNHAQFDELITPLRDQETNLLSFETVHERKNGSSYPVDIHLQFKAKETPPVFTAIVQDITERHRQLENLLIRDRAMATVDVGVIITDARQNDLPIVYVNATIETMTGYTASEMMGRNPRMLQGDDHDQPELEQIRVALKNTESVQVILRNYTKNGTMFKDEVTISPVFNTSGEVTHFIGVQRDVTARLETEAQLLHAQKIDAVGQLSGGIAHDFNNLLSVITGNLEFLSMELQDEKLKQFVDDADNAAQMGARLTARLLRFARQSPLEPSIVDVNKQVLEALELLRSTIGETITLSSNLKNNLWVARVDPSEIENTIINLAINARDAMPEGGRINIQTANVHIDEDEINRELELTPGDYIRISVEDNGDGMSDAIKDRIFEPFFTTKETGKGTGLGLAGIYGFAKQTGGQVNVYSEAGHGTKVNVYLPRHTNPVTDETRQEQLNNVTLQTGGIRVLVVEDNDMVRKITLRRLQALGYVTVQAENGPAAVDLLKNDSQFALILSDVVMDGGMSGYDVARWVQINLPACKVLLTSGFSEHMADASDIDVANLKVLQKPYSLIELQQAVDTALKNAAVKVIEPRVT